LPITASNLYAIAAVLLAAGCRCSDGASSSAAAVSSSVASAAPSATNQPSCKLRAGQFSLSPTDGRTAVAADEEDLDLPFAVELGEAVRYQSGFAVTGLRASQNGNQAVLAVLPKGLQGARVVELGAVHGDVAPPRLAVAGDNLIAVVPEADASGQSLRLALLQPEATEPVRWGASVHDGEDESQAVELAVGAARTALVWDDWDKAANHGVVKLATTGSQDVTALSVPQVVSPPNADAESPRIVSTRDGFWVAWAVNDEAPNAPSQREALPRNPGAAGETARGEESEDPRVEERTLVAVQRGIELLKLDASGAPQGAARRVTPAGLRVTQFDLGSDAQGAAYIAWRAGASSLASEGGELGLLAISANGDETRLPLAEMESGAGVPQLLFEERGLGVLAVAQPGEEMALLEIMPGSTPPVLMKATLAQAAPVALAGRDLLLVRPVGRALLFTVAHCQ
jgi:hypothetical protein